MLRTRLGRVSLGLGLGPKKEGMTVYTPGNLTFTPKEIGAISPKATVCSV